MQELHASIRSQLAIQAADLRSLAHRLTSGPEAEDCVQNTMVVALSQREQPRKMRSWLRTVLRNEIHAHHRSGGRRRNRESAFAIPEPTLGLDDRAQREQIATVLGTLLDRLEEPYRTTLRRRFLLEHSAARIAEDEGCSPATMRWRVHEGLRRMRRMLDERFEGRQQWLGGMALLVGMPVEPAAPNAGEEANTTMTNTTLASGLTSLSTKLVLAAAALTGASVFAVSAMEPTPASATERPTPSASIASAMTPARTALRLAEVSPETPAPCDDGACASLAAPPIEDATAEDTPDLATLGGNARSKAFEQRIVGCMETVDPTRQWGRVEIELETLDGTPEGPGSIQRLEVTTGRKIPCVDPVDEPSPADADGVEHHEELAACLWPSLEPDAFYGPGVTGERRTMMMAFIHGADADVDPEPALPAADEALAATDPEQAPAALSLPRLGSTNEAAVPVVECLDYDCPFCRRSQATVSELLDRHDDVAFHVLQNPLAMHEGAVLAARAALAAQAQGQFWAMHEALFDDRELRTVPALVAKATALGMDAARFEHDLSSEEIGRQVATQAAVCTNAGARGTPSFFVGGDLVPGAQGYQVLAEALEFEKNQ